MAHHQYVINVNVNATHPHLHPHTSPASTSCGVVDDEAHLVWGCPALVDQRVQHSELFEDSDITTVADSMQQDAGQLAAFLRVCHDHCAELEGCTSNRD